MPYCTTADILEQLPEAVVISITDDGNTGAVDESVVARAIDNAGAAIDTYCQRRYTVPLSPVPTMIRRLAVDMAIYDLYARRDLALPKVREDKQQAAMRFLEQVAGGKIELGASTPAPIISGSGAVVFGPDRRFVRQDMEGL